MAVPEGKRLGRYEIRSLLGVGGMGEVYLVQDTQLRRFAALKLLPPEFTRDEERLRRFKQEAFAASALNHPNILTIYEIGFESGIHFIATEYIEGISMRQRMNQGAMTIQEILDLGAQIAAALYAAHAAGIVHRDIKPDNIMIRSDGYLKVLDFGLAKLSDYQGLTSDSEAATIQVVKTDPGKVMGTAHYMSPEQTRGLELDARTDIWSLGVILYELIAGRVPFGGSTASDVVANILTTEPVPVQRYSAEVPAELQRIIKKSLRKDPNERYQLAREVALDLKNLKRELEINAEIERSIQPLSVTNSGSGIYDNSVVPSQTSSHPGSNQSTSSRSRSTAQYVTSELKAHPKAVGLLMLLAGLIAFTGILAIAYRWLIASEHSRAFSSNMRITRLTSTGSADKAAISPDGKYLVHVANDNGQQSLRVRQVNTTSDVQIVAPSDVQYSGLTFSRDGDFIFYVASSKTRSTSDLYVIGGLGGTPRKILSEVDSGVTFSPDGKQLAFIRNYGNEGEDAVIIATTSGGSEQRVAVRKLPNFFRSVSWSPDGKKLVCGAGSFVPSYNSYLVEVAVASGEEKQIGNQSWKLIGDVGWASSGEGLIVAASEKETASFDSQQLWYVSYPQGEPRRITNDLNNYRGVSLTSDSSRLVSIQSESTANIWFASVFDTSNTTEVSSGAGRVDGREGLATTPDGQIVY
ncbi:MAG: protein kinase, partial [Pyrinomonadaceae bacterium]